MVFVILVMNTKYFVKFVIVMKKMSEMQIKFAGNAWN